MADGESDLTIFTFQYFAVGNLFSHLNILQPIFTKFNNFKSLADGESDNFHISIFCNFNIFTFAVANLVL